MARDEEFPNGDTPLYIRSLTYNFQDVLEVEKAVNEQVTSFISLFNLHV
jgi:Na+-translocating ferredoxin:NAD+ oxidoreductase RnfC subunit